MDGFFFVVKNRSRVDQHSKKGLLFVREFAHLKTQDIAYIK